MAYRLKDYLYNDKLTKEQNILMDRLYKLRMSGMAEAFENQLLEPNTGLEPFDSSIYDPERQLNTHVIELLAKCDWIDEPNNLLMTGGAGAGKTHIACALCITAMHQNRTVKYIRANTLLKESDHARQEGTYFEYSNEMAAYDLMVIDDFGLMDLDIEKCRDLFEIIESRDCRKATIIISQIPVSGWYQLFGDSTYADACLSRMTSKAYRLEFPGRDRRVNNGN